jgi:hypothetical protein
VEFEDVFFFLFKRVLYLRSVSYPEFFEILRDVSFGFQFVEHHMFKNFELENHFNIIFPILLFLSGDPFLPGILTKIHLCHACYIPLPSHSLYHPNNIW